MVLALLSGPITGCCLEPVAQSPGGGLTSSADGGDSGSGPCFCANPNLGYGWCYSPPPNGECCGGQGPCEGWCIDSYSVPVPCEGYCLVDGGLYSPAVPCDGGCGWIGAGCTPGSSAGCCAGLACGVGPPGTDACCVTDGVACFPQEVLATGAGSTCCSGHCVLGTCLHCVPQGVGPCITDDDCCFGVCRNGGCGCVNAIGYCGADRDCCAGSCVDGGCTGG